MLSCQTLQTSRSASVVKLPARSLTFGAGPRRVTKQAFRPDYGVFARGRSMSLRGRRAGLYGSPRAPCGDSRVRFARPYFRCGRRRTQSFGKSEKPAISTSEAEKFRWSTGRSTLTSHDMLVDPYMWAFRAWDASQVGVVALCGGAGRVPLHAGSSASFVGRVGSVNVRQSQPSRAVRYGAGGPRSVRVMVECGNCR